MRFTLIAVGKLKNPHWRALADDYSTRITRQARLDIIEIRDATPHREGERLIAALDKLQPGHCYALSEEGPTLSSATLASTLGQHPSSSFAFIIGGAHGLDPAVKEHPGTHLLSLSPMTFPHEMARVLLLEQLYRALSILSGSGYHHA